MKKLILISLLSIFAISLVIAGAVYFHTVKTTLEVTEARSSADLPLTLQAYSGDTVCRNVTISNAGQNPLYSILSYTVDSNPDLVTYTSNIDSGLEVETLSGETNTYEVCFYVNEVTEAGIVELTINYEKTTTP